MKTAWNIGVILVALAGIVGLSMSSVLREQDRLLDDFAQATRQQAHACGRYSAAGSSPYGVPSIVANSPDALTGLFYGGGGKVLMAQGIGSLIVCSATFAAAMAMFWALKAVRLLRVSKEGELQGLDLDQHGISAYPEYVISALAAPHGMGRDTVGSGNLARAPESLNPATVVGGE